MTRTGGSDTIAYVADGTDWAESGATVGFGVNAQDAGGAGNEANESTFGDGTGGTPLLYNGIDTAETVASSAGPTAGVDTNVAYRVQVSGSQAAGDYSGNVSLCPSRRVGG